MPDWKPTPRPFPGCMECSHLQARVRCAAYPGGIPILIASSEVDHLVERPGQQPGILFEPKRQTQN